MQWGGRNCEHAELRTGESSENVNSYIPLLLISTRHMKQLSKLFAFHTVNNDCTVGTGMICQLMLLLGSAGENMNID